jgi:hypothetical protein
MAYPAARRWVGSAFIQAFALISPTLAPGAAYAEVIPARQMAQGVKSTPAQCAMNPNAVWVTVARRGFCIRYYMSSAGGEGPVPVVWLSGDKLGRVDMRTREISLREDERDVTTEQLERTAENLSKQARTTAIYLARMGLDGSSGYHGYRRSWLELYVMQAALDAIKKKHGFTGFHIAGQSGGAGLVGGLIALREDIVCAVPGAGRLALLKKPRQEEDADLEFFDAAEGIQTIARRRGLRLIVITDPEDKRVRVEHQEAFVRALRQAGGRVEHHFVEAADENRHFVSVYTRLALAGCVRGKNEQEIAAALVRLQERHLAAMRERQKAKSAGAQPPQSPQPVSAPRVAPTVQHPGIPRPTVQHPTIPYPGRVMPASTPRTAGGAPARRFN